MAAPQTEAERRRALRRRHVHERQAVVFGSLVAALAVAGLGSAAVYSGALSVPFLEREFSTPAPEKVAAALPPPPCPPEGTLPLPYTAIGVNVLNGSGRTGLAGQTSTELAARGFVIFTTGDYPASIPSAAQINFGQAGLASAYTLAASVQAPVLVLDARQDTSVDLVLGETFAPLLDPAAVVLDPNVPLPPQPGCVPLEEALAAAAPAPAPAEAPPAEDAPAPEG